MNSFPSQIASLLNSVFDQVCQRAIIASPLFAEHAEFLWLLVAPY
eukprot:COSAG01_NODE_46_length_32080_cov_716.589319_23_plen_45_part_00